MAGFDAQGHPQERKAGSSVAMEGDLIVTPEQYCKPFFDLYLRRLENSDIDLGWVSTNIPDVYEVMEKLQKKILRGTESRRLSEVMADVRAWWDAFQLGLDLQHELKFSSSRLSEE